MEVREIKRPIETADYDAGSVSGLVTNESGEQLPNTVVFTAQFEDVEGNTVTIEPNSGLGTTEERVLNTEFEVAFNDAGTIGIDETDTVTGQRLHDGYNFSGIRSVRLDGEAASEDGFTLLTFADDQRPSYTLGMVPAQNDFVIDSVTGNQRPVGVDYSTLQGVQLETGETGFGSVMDVRVGSTSAANIVITTPRLTDGRTGSPTEEVTDELWLAVTDSGELSLGNLGDAIQAYQEDPENAEIDGVSITLSDLGSLIQYYQSQVA